MDTGRSVRLETWLAQDFGGKVVLSVIPSESKMGHTKFISIHTYLDIIKCAFHLDIFKTCACAVNLPCQAILHPSPPNPCCPSSHTRQPSSLFPALH